jgi:hypothetical protein
MFRFHGTIIRSNTKTQYWYWYWYICQLQLGWHPVAVHIYT